MLPAKFKVGDKVCHKRTGRILTVIDCKYNPAVVTCAIRVRIDGSIDTSPTTICEYWSYKLNDGKYWRYWEELLEHVESSSK